MSEWRVEVVRIGKVGKHPNADRLSITSIHGFPVICQAGLYKEGDIAVYIAEDSIVPDTEEFHWLAPAPKLGAQGEVIEPTPPVGEVPERYRRIRAKKLRGIYSEGLLHPCPQDWVPGTDVSVQLNITRYEKPEDPMSPGARSGGRAEAGPKHFRFPVYTDIEPLRKFHSVLEPNELVVITEKIHGANARFVFDGKRLWVGSHNQVKGHPRTQLPWWKRALVWARLMKAPRSNWWWTAAENLDLKHRLQNFPMTVFFGEVYGSSVQRLQYNQTIDLRLFDTYDCNAGRYNDWKTTQLMAVAVDLKTVPVLYEGPWLGFDKHEALAEGNSTLANHVREGFVVKPLQERHDTAIGRVIMKLVGKEYKLKKE